MVKPDPAHNYYADLDLPTSASVDDVRKAYRKLALQYHPDRNAGKEAECVPRFQAIQAANEVLSDSTTKTKYDQDRRKAGLYPTFKASAPTTGNPYAATSAFPPPPRRTQPGAWTRASSNVPGNGTTPTGADRFTNFTKPASSMPRKDPTAERTQQFRAWQNMNSAPERPRYSQQAPPAPPRSPSSQAKQQNTTRPRAQRQDTKMPTEEQIRAGMRHGQTAATEGQAAEKQSAWQAFQTSNAGKPGASRPKTQRRAPTTPKRSGGFDPKAPGSDERPAPTSTGHYSHRHRSEDVTGDGFPPPPPGPPPGTFPTSPLSPNSQKPFLDPLRPFHSRNGEVDVPYAEGNRKSTPYSTFIGERTSFSSEGLRRSASTRDATKLRPEDAAFRAKSSSPPLSRQTANKSAKQPFVPGMYSDSSDANSSEVTEEGSSNPDHSAAAADFDDGTTGNQGRPSTAPTDAKPIQSPRTRPIRKPTAPSSKLNASNLSADATTNHAMDAPVPPDAGRPNMEQRNSSANMYASPSPCNNSFFSPGEWIANAFGHCSQSTQRKASVPGWAVPSSILPNVRRKGYDHATHGSRGDVRVPDRTSDVTKIHFSLKSAPLDVQNAFLLFRMSLRSSGTTVEQLNQLNLDDFSKLVSTVRSGKSTGDYTCDSMLRDVFDKFPSVGAVRSPKKLADIEPANSFTLPVNHDTFQPTDGKSRSAEDINTNFSPNGWDGSFKGSADYFPPLGRRTSPNRRTPSNRPSRQTTMDMPPLGNSTMPPPLGPDGAPSASPQTSPATDVNFNEEQWKNTFKDSSWTWPPPPPTPQSGAPTSRTPSRKASTLRSKSSADNPPAAGSREAPHIIEDSTTHDQAAEKESLGANPVIYDADAMEIDTPPNAAHANTAGMKEPRLYSVPPSVWRQEQQKQQDRKSFGGRKTSVEQNLKVNLDDLSNVEPMAKGAAGLRDLNDISATLPFDSKAESTTSIKSREPEKLQMPALPKVPKVPEKLSKANWHTYALSFQYYLQHYHNYSRTMLTHFETREKHAEARLLRGSTWLEATGDTTDKLGWDSYVKGVREDEQVRTAWLIGCEKHSAAVEEFDQIRERVKKLAFAGALVDA